MKPRIILAGTTYADNLGDGVIAECFRHAIHTLQPNTEVILLDIAGRQNYGQAAVPVKRRLTALLDKFPEALKPWVVAPLMALLLARKPYWQWRKLLRPTDRLVIGGGHMLLDHYLNFPLKLAALTHAAKAKGTPVAVHAVGVSKHWSCLGRALFAYVIGPHLKRLSVRDDGALRYLNHHLPSTKGQAVIARDPGLLAAETYADEPATCHGIGINISAPAEVGGANAQAQTIFWHDLVTLLVKQGHQVHIFTNGAGADDAYAQGVYEELHRRNVAVTLLPRAITARQLVGQIKGLKGMVAHRLHANIVAYSFGVPAIGLAWDDKLAAFFALAGMPERCIPRQHHTAAHVAKSLTEILGHPPSLQHRNALMAETRQGVQDVLTCFANT